MSAVYPGHCFTAANARSTLRRLLGGTSLASAKSRGAAGAHSKLFHPGINETMPRPTVADPYYRLSDSYYGDSDPYHGLFDFCAVPPYSPGSACGHVKPIGR